MLIMSSLGTRISLRTAEPFAVTRNVTWNGLPSGPFPSQVPGNALMASKAFCASVCARTAVAASPNKASVRMRSFECVMIVSSGHSFLLAGSSFRLPRVLGFDKTFQIVQARGPEHPVLLDPGVHRSQRLRIQLVNAMPPLAVLAYKMGAPQQAQVF